jgi:hypothetical protein
MDELDPASRGDDPRTLDRLDRIAAKITKIYEFFIKIGYLTAEEVSFPPHRFEHAPQYWNDKYECELDDLVITFLEKIPFPTSTGYDLTVDSPLVAWNLGAPGLLYRNRPRTEIRSYKDVPSSMVALTTCRMDSTKGRALVLRPKYGETSSFALYLVKALITSLRWHSHSEDWLQQTYHEISARRRL